MHKSSSVSSLFLNIRMHTHARKRHTPTRSRKSSAVHVFHGVPEAPCVGPKYYTQTVAITSKPEIPHSTFLIPAARLLSWAPHEEPLLEREGACISLCSLCLSVCLSQPSFSLRPNISHCHPLRLWLSCSVYLSISPSAGLSLSYLFLLSSSTVLFVTHSPVSDWCCLSAALFLSTRLLTFPFVSPSVSRCLSLRLPLPLCLQIFT